MLKKRIIPCLDIKDGKTVKGIQFESLADAGDPIFLAKKYADEGADELIFLDIAAFQEGRKTLINLVKSVAKEINIPFTVGGGISSKQDVNEILKAGADKISINTAAIYYPSLINDLKNEFGSQCIVVAIDAKLINGTWKVFGKGGNEATGKDVLQWAREANDRGAGEILLTSINNDGTKSGYNINLTKVVAESIDIPLIASGGAGCKEDFRVLFENTLATGALAASIFHFEETKISAIKNYLFNHNISIRL